MVRSIAIINQKGGCGKTTTAINLAAVLARAGKRVLLVDMDPQGHCAAGLGIPDHRIESDIGDAMLSIGGRPIDQSRLLWRAVRNLDLAPARMKLAGLESARGGLADAPDKERRLSRVLEKFAQEYDVAVIDCSPSIGLLTYNALVAADMALIPVETSFFSLQGAERQVGTVTALSKRLGVQIPVWLLPTMHDADNAIATDLLEEMSRRFADRLVPVTIRLDQRLREATSFGQTVIDYAPASMGAEDYGRLGVWAIKHLEARRSLPADQLSRDTGNDESFAVKVSGDEPGAVTTGPRSAPAMVAPAPNSEVKLASRAEDVARRAQEFLRRVALGKGAPARAESAQPQFENGVETPLIGRGSNQPTAPAPMPMNLESTAATFTAGPVLGRTVTRTAVASLPQEAIATMPTPSPRQVLHIAPGPHFTSAPVNQGVRPLLGVRQTRQGLLFVQPIGTAKTMAVAGTFNNWQPEATPMRRNDALGVFEACVKVPAGKHEYRIVVDGAWSADPHNPSQERNPFGDSNSVFFAGDMVA